jgi:riboflavin kinase
VVPGRTHYPEDIVELVAPVGLRAALGLKDNDIVTVEVDYD